MTKITTFEERGQHMKDKRVMSYFGHVIWKNEAGYMVAKGDGTDEYFKTIYEAMEWIEKQEGIE